MNELNKTFYETLKNTKINFLPLKQVTIWNRKFNFLNGSSKEKINLKIFSTKELKNLLVENGDIKLISPKSFDGHTTREKVKNKINNREIIVLRAQGEPNTRYWKGEFVISSNTLVASSIDSNLYNLKYIYYFLILKKELIDSYYQGFDIKIPIVNKILDIVIPFPSIKIQNKIVKILDSFTTYKNNLITKLKLEHDKREQQYLYYRNKLFSFEENIKYNSLNEICKIRMGEHLRKKHFVRDGKYDVIAFKDESYGKIDRFNFKKNTITIIGQGNSVGFVDLQKKNFFAGPACFCINFDETKINHKYLYYILKNKQNEILSLARGGFIKQIPLKKLNSLKIPIPPSEIQKKVVIILDQFSQSTEKLKSLILHEKELREKEYHYFINSLLSFK